MIVLAIQLIFFSCLLNIKVLGLLSDNITEYNYCEFNKFCRSAAHIGCLYHKDWLHDKCEEYFNVTITEFDDDTKEILLNLHNKYRNQVALGLLEGFDKAARMPTLSWDETLEYLAELNVRQCDMIHDICKLTNVYRYAGQNLCIATSYKYSEIPDIIEDCLGLWFEEYVYTDRSVMSKFRKNRKNPIYGHFTQMMIDRSHKIGCSMTTFYDNSLHVFYYLLACDYASTNVIGYPVYRSLKEESECEKGQNPAFEGLCHPDEDIDPNLLLRY